MTSETTFAPIAVVPRSLCYELLLTADTPLSHHDPAVQDDSNRTLFNRQKQLRSGQSDASLPDQATLDALCEVHRVPASITDLFSDLTFPEFLASALVRLFLDLYNSQAGTGLFEGMERYSRLEARLHQAAVCSHTLTALWNRLVSSLQVGIHGGEYDRVLLDLLTLPKGLQALVLQVLADDYRSAIALARLWHSEVKLTDARYAEAAGKPQVTELLALGWDAAQLTAGSDQAQVIEVPTVSGNSLRHQLVREPAWLHLCQELGLTEATPGRGPVPPGVEAIFYNGGNIESGAKQPSDTYSLTWRARALYPSLDLLGGVTDSFDLGESRLRVAGWLVCRENRTALQGSPAYDLPAATVSVFDLLDDVTLTRQAGRAGLGQMIYSFETLCPGAQVLCKLHLAPHTPRLTRGALVAAVETYLQEDGTLGGQAARGFGRVRGEWLKRPEGDVGCREEYERYLAANRELLLAGLRDGTLGTGKVLLS